MVRPALVYSAEDLKELLTSTSPTVLNLVKPMPSAPSSTEQAAFLTNLSDKENIELLKSRPYITCVLPVRKESAQEDVENHAAVVTKVVMSSGGSIILAGHDEKTVVANYSLLESVERWQVIQDFGQFAGKTKTFADFKEICMTVCSELVTNAFYNAPRDKDGKPLQTNRRVPITLDKAVNISFGQDEQFVWLKVTDPFGTFDRNPLLNTLLKSASVEELTVNFGEGGAGIGLFMVFRWAAQLLFSFKPGQETTVLVKLLKARRYKTFESQRAILEIINPE
jgi:hypothetical protein